jgi:hypothetical protein
MSSPLIIGSHVLWEVEKYFINVINKMTLSIGNNKLEVGLWRVLRRVVFMRSTLT